MLTDNQLRLIIERVIQESIIGISRENPMKPASIPTAYDIKVATDNIIKQVGKPTFQAVHQIVNSGGELLDYTSASKFNENLYRMIDDFTVITNTILTQIYAMTRHIYASEFEMYKIGNRLREVYGEVNRILLTHRNANGFLHATGDSFDSSTYVDMSMSKNVEVSNGAAKLRSYNSKLLNLASSNITFQAFKGSNYSMDNLISNVNTYNTSLSDMFSGSKLTPWMCSFKIGGYDDHVGIRILIPLTNDGRDVRVNRIMIKTTPTTNPINVRLMYTNDSTSRSMPLNARRGDGTLAPVTKVLGARGTTDVEFILTPMETSEASSDLINPMISTLEVIMTKSEPDEEDGTYTFTISEFKIYATDSAEKGELVTLPRELTSSKSTFSVNELSLFTDDFIPEGCGIDYYIGIDPWESGYLTANGPQVIWNEDLKKSDMYEWTSDPSYNGNKGVRASELRRLGIDGWIDWEPSWMPILPVNSNSSIVSASGIHGKILPLGAYDIVENASNFMNDQDDSVNNGVSYYKIYEFDNEPSEIILRQGRKCWKQYCSSSEHYMPVEVNAKFINEGSYDYTLYIGPHYDNSIGYVRSQGPIVKGSITSIMWAQGNMDDPNQSLIVREDISNNILGDVHIDYDGTNAIIHKNTGTVWKFPDDEVKLRYLCINVADSYSIIETNIYVPAEASPVITFTNVDGVKKVIIAAPDSSSIADRTYSSSQLVNNVKLQLQNGWNRVIIYLTLGIKWSPLDNIILPEGLEWYADFAPLEVVGINTLQYNTHRDDHSRCAVMPYSGYYYLMVNDPITPVGTLSTNGIYQNDGIIYWYEDGIIDDVFTTTDDVNDFYDLTYRTIGNQYTHVILKAIMRGHNNSSPAIYSYEIRGGDKLDITIR